MSENKSVPPYRKRCAPQGKVCLSRKPYRHKRPSDIVTSYYNSTTPTPTWQDGPANTGGGCDCSDPKSQSASGQDWASAFQGPATGEQWQGAAADLLTVQSFTSGAPVDKGECRQIGFKNVAAQRYIHGANGFTFCTPPTVKKTYKYKKIRLEWALNVANLSPGSPFVDYFNKANGVTEFTVDDETGVITVSDHEFVLDASTTAGSFDGSGNWTDSSATFFSNAYTGRLVLLNSPLVFVNALLSYFGVKPSCGLVRGKDMYDLCHDECYDSIGGTDNIVMTGDASSATASETVVVGSVTYTRSNAASISETSFHFQESNSDVGPSLSNSSSFSMTVTLSQTNAVSDLLDDCYEMLKEWNLSDNAIYPWRNDHWVMIMPLLVRREVQANVDLPAPNALFASDDYEDPNSLAGYDGVIIGKPKPAGYAGWFDFYFSDWRWCKDGSSPSCEWLNYLAATGASLADARVSLPVVGFEESDYYDTFLPSNATHFVNCKDALKFKRGATIDIGGICSGITVVKWAETRQPVPSYNFARPCGSDRVAIDESAVSDIALISGSDITVNNPFTPGSTVLVAFTPGSDGIYAVAGYSSPTITLGTKLADLPTDYYHDYEGNYTVLGGMIGNVRWPDAPPLCGRQSITIADAGSGHTQITFASEQTNLRVGDALDFSTDAMASVQSNKAVLTRTSDTVFIVDVAFASMTGAAYATSHGAAAWYWNDDSQKFTYVYQSWQYDGLAATTEDGDCKQSCQVFTPCAPQVVCFSPNFEESFSNGQKFWFGADGLQDIILDVLSPSNVVADVAFQFANPLWQAPTPPSGVDGAEDAGGCLADGDPTISTVYYAPRPLIEAMCEPPTSSNGAGASSNEAAPALPTGITWPSIAQPQSFEDGGLQAQPWDRFMAELAQEGEGCRFEPYYYALNLI